MNHQALSAFIWSVADLLRGDYKPADYGSVILPFTVLRRLDCVLAPTKADVLAEMEQREKAGLNPEPFLRRKSGASFFNTSTMDLQKLLGDPDNIAPNLTAYLQGFSAEVRDIFEKFELHNQIDKLARAKLLFLVTEKFAGIDLHPDKVPNSQMGLVFEELIRKFAEASNETAGDHFTPREVISLMVNLLFVEDDDVLSKPGVVRTIYDPTAGTGGMLSVAEEHLADLNPAARLTMSGQELNPESYAICKADMLIKGQDVTNIAFGNTLSDDGHAGATFDYMLANPPFGVEWKKVEKEVRREHEQQGFNGRFGPGLPRVSDGSLLFLMHMLSKMRPATEGGCRFGIVLNGSPLFTGGAGSGESEIRRYMLQNDLVEAIIALPTDMFYNTGIATYVWIVSNRKPANRKGQVQLIDGSGFWQKMRKSLGSKRKELSAEHIALITQLFGRAEEAEIAALIDTNGKEVAREVVWAGEQAPEAPEGGKVKLAPLSRLFPNSAFGYRTITVERPQRDEDGNVVLAQRGKAKGKPQPDSALRDTENVPLDEDVDAYFAREVLPHAEDAWIDESKTKVGYEIPFNRQFYVFEPPRPLEEIDADLKQATDRIKAMIEELAA
ncbi:type I restriction-modification system subunit M [Sphingopyxis terrae]|uniref:site-specific DNA-methyltransferase (adenine-specific) n=1 Tax=Sphingopyxis terrae subsp. ummariensis TaxID=429001 RepID=A0A1Y6E4X6_9SPHN|nr:class I SAM-dependent DNA methyltransferase [Sphingopyxis terrae]PCF92714.1 SAM-dependent DNA methyltransferase [Sphingopyxis terrae subsp. ummariensis]SMQ57828.1 type I restriction enzyme M protein [Sphingopyxis terrae subsp. ummariensis]